MTTYVLDLDYSPIDDDVACFFPRMKASSDEEYVHKLLMHFFIPSELPDLDKTFAAEVFSEAFLLTGKRITYNDFMSRVRYDMYAKTVCINDEPAGALQQASVGFFKLLGVGGSRRMRIFLSRKFD